MARLVVISVEVWQIARRRADLQNRRRRRRCGMLAPSPRPQSGWGRNQGDTHRLSAIFTLAGACTSSINTPQYRQLEIRRCFWVDEADIKTGRALLRDAEWREARRGPSSTDRL
jgi:hypothetical protein